MKAGRVIGIIKRVWITLGLSFTVIFVLWSVIAYRPNMEAKRSLLGDDRIAVDHRDGGWRFIPRVSRDSAYPDRVAFVFIPGALVDPVAYAPLVRAVALAGYPAILVEVPRRGAFVNAHDPVVRERVQSLLATTGATRWVVAGHSKGGVFSSNIASEHPPGLVGMVLIGTSHPRDVDLSSVTFPVTKIVGTRDGLASRNEVDVNRAKLPLHTTWVWVEGGNHSQFGWYGFQPGDSRAKIAAFDQRQQMIDATLALMATVSR